MSTEAPGQKLIHKCPNRFSKMLDQGSVRTKVSKIFTCNCWPWNRFAIGLLPDLRPEQISNHWASCVWTIDQASRPFGPSVRTLDRVIWPKSPWFVRIVGRVYPILSRVLHRGGLWNHMFGINENLSKACQKSLCWPEHHVLSQFSWDKKCRRSK